MYGKTSTGLQRGFSRLLAAGPFIFGRCRETIWLAISIYYTCSIWMDVSAGLQNILGEYYVSFYLFFGGNFTCYVLKFYMLILATNIMQYVIKVTKLLALIKFLSEKGLKKKTFSMIDKLDNMAARETISDR